MLTFLRKIRFRLLEQATSDKVKRSLIESGSTRKYLLYAVGEILLVMVGILLALQVNNWNEERKVQNLEQTYLLALKNEFQINLEEVTNQLDKSEGSLKNANELMFHTGPSTPSITEERFSELFLGATLGELQYRPSTGVLKEILSSGKLDIFRNEELRISLGSWESQLQKIKFQEDVEHSRVRLSLIGFLSDEGNTRKMIIDRMAKQFDFDQTQFKTRNVDVLQSEKFENLLTGFIATGQFLNQGYYIPLKEEIESILTLINSELTTRF